MNYVGIPRSFTFTVLNHSNVPVTSLTLGTFTVNPTYLLPDTYVFYTIVFQRNGIPCTDTLGMVSNGDGSYTLSYTPSTVGNDFIDIFDPIDGLRFSDSADIMNTDGLSNVVNLNQNYGGSEHLQILIASPQTYALYVFESSGWVLGNTAPSFALGYTALDTSGNWINSIPVSTPGTYHIVIIGPDLVQVVFPFLSVS